MLNLEDYATGKLYPAMTDAERVTASQNTGNLHWVGAHVRAAIGALTAGKVGDHVQMSLILDSRVVAFEDGVY